MVELKEGTQVLPAEVLELEESCRRVETALAGPGRMVWRAWGEGPTLVLLHGGHGSWTHWLRNIRALSQHFTVLAPDMPGYGDSDLPDPISTPIIAEAIAAGLDQLGVENARMVGFSFGGIVAGHVAHLRMMTIRRLVLVGAGGLNLPRPPMTEFVRWRKLTGASEIRAAHRENLRILMIHDRQRIDELAVFLQERNTRRCRFTSRPGTHGDSLLRCLRELDAPLAGIWGRHDGTAAPHIELRGDLLRRLDPGAEFKIIEDSGHWVQYERPEAFNETLLDILLNGRDRR